MFCRDCIDPHLNGAVISMWDNAYRPAGYHIHAELLYAVPNDASNELMNPVFGAAVMVDRGGASFATKARNVQRAGGIAVVLVDDGSCTDHFECGGWLGSRKSGEASTFVASGDPPELWAGITIPLVLVTRDSGARLRSHMELVEAQVEGFGMQRYVPG